MYDYVGYTPQRLLLLQREYLFLFPSLSKQKESFLIIIYKRKPIGR